MADIAETVDVFRLVLLKIDLTPEISKGKAMDHEGNRVKTSLSRQVLVSYKLLGVLMAF